KKDEEPEDDSYDMYMTSVSRNPLELNNATDEELMQLHLLSPIQIKNFIAYRNLLGPLISVHELQAIPGWDLEDIRQLLPFIKISPDVSLLSVLSERWKHGENEVLIRTGRVLEKSRGYEKPVQTGEDYYMGSPQKLFVRYTYNYKQLLSFGFSG